MKVKTLKTLLKEARKRYNKTIDHYSEYDNKERKLQEQRIWQLEVEIAKKTKE